MWIGGRSAFSSLRCWQATHLSTMTTRWVSTKRSWMATTSSRPMLSPRPVSSWRASCVLIAAWDWAIRGTEAVRSRQTNGSTGWTGRWFTREESRRHGCLRCATWRTLSTSIGMRRALSRWRCQGRSSSVTLLISDITTLAQEINFL